VALTPLSRLSAARFAWSVVLLLAATGCASTAGDNTAGLNPAKLYSDARGEMDSGSWDKAIALLDKLEGRAAGTPLAQQAQIDKAYSHYKNGEPALAIATIDRFSRLHPTSPGLDYALYLKGVASFNGDLGLFGFLSEQDLSERDQKAVRESFEAFKELIQRFPESKYSVDAKDRTNYILNAIAASEVHVAEFYYKNGAYIAAINRAQHALNEFKDVPALEEALKILIKSYAALDMQDMKNDAQRVLDRTYGKKSLLIQNIQDTSKQKQWWRFW
jgi:outer membrane protein assembly factor BamD